MTTMRTMNQRLSWFKKHQQRKLRENTHKSDPRGMTLPGVMNLVRKEMVELTIEVSEYLYTFNEEQTIKRLKNIIDECEDVSKTAMMLADKAKNELDNINAKEQK